MKAIYTRNKNKHICINKCCFHNTVPHLLSVLMSAFGCGDPRGSAYKGCMADPVWFCCQCQDNKGLPRSQSRCQQSVTISSDMEWSAEGNVWVVKGGRKNASGTTRSVYCPHVRCSNCPRSYA